VPRKGKENDAPFHYTPFTFGLLANSISFYKDLPLTNTTHPKHPQY